MRLHCLARQQFGIISIIIIEEIFLNKLKWIIFVVITVGIFGVLVISSKSNQLDVSGVDINAIQTANNQNGNIAEHISGKIGSKVTLMEYGDFQCPACGTAYTRIKPITDQYKNQLQFVFRNFPLTSIHPNGKAAAGVVEAAGLQGKYWEMFDKIYTTQSAWSNLSGTERTTFFEKYASGLGLDTVKFTADMASVPVNNKISYDQAIGFKAKVEATPTYFLNGTKLDQTISGDATKLKDAINAELTKAGIALPK